MQHRLCQMQWPWYRAPRGRPETRTSKSNGTHVSSSHQCGLWNEITRFQRWKVKTIIRFTDCNCDIVRRAGFHAAHLPHLTSRVAFKTPSSRAGSISRSHGGLAPGGDDISCALALIEFLAQIRPPEQRVDGAARASIVSGQPHEVGVVIAQPCQQMNPQT